MLTIILTWNNSALFDIVDLKELKELMFRELDLLSRHLYDTTIVRLIIDTAVMGRTGCMRLFHALKRLLSRRKRPMANHPKKAP